MRQPQPSQPEVLLGEASVGSQRTYLGEGKERENERAKSKAQDRNGAEA